MNAINFGRTALFALALGSVLSACETSSKTKNDSGEIEIDRDNDRMGNNEMHPEFMEFRRDAMVKIEANETRIAGLKNRLSETGGDAPLDNMRANRIETLQAKNADLRLRLVTYENKPSDWDKFKSEFNHDMNSFEEAFKDLGTDDVNK